MFYLPTIVLFMLAFFVLLVLLFALIMVGTISYAFDKVGLDPGAVFGLLLACLAWLLAPAQAPMVAYISGSFGVLIGADLLNLRNLAALRAPVVSLGGAGTFDGIFLT